MPIVLGIRNSVSNACRRLKQPDLRLLEKRKAAHTFLEQYLMHYGNTQVLKAQGQEIVSPDQRSGLHPLAIPLARGPAVDDASEDASISGDTVYTCLLRWPAAAASQVYTCCAPASLWHQ